MKTLKIFLKLCEMNLKTLFVYRASFFVSLISNLMFVISYILFIESLFLHVNKIGALNKGEVLLVMAFFYLFQNISDIFYRDNFENFSNEMRRGLLDTLITKPVSSRLLTFFHKMRFDYIAALFITGLQFWYAWRFIEKPFAPQLFMTGMILSLVAASIMFSIFSIIATFTFWIEKNDTLHNIAWHLMQIARYPRDIYTGIARMIFTYIIPLGLIANIPAEFALKISSGKSILIFLALAMAFFYLSLWFWNFGLKRYTSAG